MSDATATATATPDHTLMEALPPPPKEVSGWLWKEGHVVNSWKHRWVVIQHGRLQYSAEPGGKLLGELHLAGASVGPCLTAKSSSTDLWFGAPKVLSCWLVQTGAAARAAQAQLKMHEHYIFGVPVTDESDEHAAEWQAHFVAHAR